MLKKRPQAGARKRRRISQNMSRQGTVSVEMAFCLPILFVMFTASIDLIRYNLLRNVVTQATYEGARTALVKGATVADVEQAVNSTMVAFNPDLNYTIDVAPASLPSLTDTIEVTVVCDLSGEGWIITSNLLGDSMQNTMVLKNR